MRELRYLDVDSYVAAAVYPSEDPNRPGARWVIRRMRGEILREVDIGPLYAVEMLLDFGDGTSRRVGILAQERRRNSGVWMPEHHVRAVEIIRQFAGRAMPVVTFIDTPGADAGEIANRDNQAHSISRLIAEFAQLHVPTVGIILGNGYSGGAIPLATTNLLLCVRDGVFNTIQPRGMAGIARKYELSWQECAKYVGVSSYELLQAGLLDGIVDFVPGEADKVQNLVAAIASGIRGVERAAERFVANNPEVFEHYRRSVFRYLNPSESLQKLQLSPFLTEHTDRAAEYLRTDFPPCAIPGAAPAYQVDDCRTIRAFERRRCAARRPSKTRRAGIPPHFPELARSSPRDPLRRGPRWRVETIHSAPS